MKVNKKDLVGAIKDFPIEIVQKMIDYQFNSNGINNIKILQDPLLIETDYVFDWFKTIEGYEFWDRVIHNKEFEIYFKKYPKT